MSKTYSKAQFSTSVVAEMKVNDSICVICYNARQVHTVRCIASQYKRLSNPSGISRYASEVKQREDGMLLVTLTAKP